MRIKARSPNRVFINVIDAVFVCECGAQEARLIADFERRGRKQ